MKQIPLTQGKFAIVDDEDFEFLSQWKWHITTNGYAVRRQKIGEKIANIWMHRVIAKTPDGLVTDHIDCDKLNNQKANLRCCSKQGNAVNSSKYNKPCSSRYKGVSKMKGRNKWEAYICVDGKKSNIGYFLSEEDAAQAYNSFAIKEYGSFAQLN